MTRIGPTRFGVLMAVLHQEHPSWLTVAREVGCASSVADYHLRALRRLGLVTWEDGQHGTLRPLVEYVPVVQS